MSEEQDDGERDVDVAEVESEPTLNGQHIEMGEDTPSDSEEDN